MFDFFKKKKEQQQLKAEAEFVLPQHLKHVQESTDLIIDTSNPETFFNRLDFFNSELKHLFDCFEIIDPSHYHKIKQELETQYENLNSDDAQTLLLKHVLDNAAKKADKVKLNKTKAKRYIEAYYSVEKYKDRINVDSYNWFALKIKATVDELTKA